MSDELRFSTVLKEVPVFLTGADNIEKEFLLKELTGKQRAKYNDSFDVKIEMDEDGKAKAGGFKSFSANQFLAMCLYDGDGKLVQESVIGEFPSTVIAKLHEKALSLSGLDKKALDAAKNESEESDSSGIE